LTRLTEPKKTAFKWIEDNAERISEFHPMWDPPIDLPWPEYVTTERGYDWHIPTPKK